jgi:hypothetical protein
MQVRAPLYESLADFSVATDGRKVPHGGRLDLALPSRPRRTRREATYTGA